MRGTMRGTVGTAVPLTATSAQLRALATLFNGIERGRWDTLAATFSKMDRHRAELAPELAAMVGSLAGQLRAAARERDGELVVVDVPR
jgi:hypothetical protein